MMSSDKPA